MKKGLKTPPHEWYWRESKTRCERGTHRAELVGAATAIRSRIIWCVWNRFHHSMRNKKKTVWRRADNYRILRLFWFTSFRLSVFLMAQNKENMVAFVPVNSTLHTTSHRYAENYYEKQNCLIPVNNKWRQLSERMQNTPATSQHNGFASELCAHIFGNSIYLIDAPIGSGTKMQNDRPHANAK